ncbi:MAG: endonuclease/exonuclease/phosphatase family protein [Bacteroidaceae bacterium]|nr:endonuclease/exonuclease/phosphatase family protein [Bacteroidaceae bacterium]
MKNTKKILCLLFIALLSISCKNNKEQETKKELCLISWNCDNFRLSPDTLMAAAQLINSYQPDLICLQERPHTNLVSYDLIKRSFPQHKYKATNGREDENLNIILFSKYPLSNVKTWYFKDTYNKMIQADIDWNGETFRIYNVHLQTTGHGKNFLSNAIKRYKQSNIIKSEIKKCPYPIIICGDFNDIPLSYTVMNLVTKLKDVSRSFTGSYQKLGNLFKIDYILATPEWNKGKYELINNFWSDHKIQKNSIYKL